LEDDVREMLERINGNPSLLYDSIVNCTGNYIYIVDLRENLALISENMVGDFDFPHRIVLNMLSRWQEQIHPNDQGGFQTEIEQVLRGARDTHDMEYQAKNRQGEYIWLHDRGLLRRDEAGKPILLAGAITNLGVRGKADSVTDLLTQQECRKRVEVILQQGDECGFLLLGLDDFSRINSLNDNFFGDLVLRRLAQDLQRVVCGNGNVYRFEGDKFALMVPDATEKKMREIYHEIYRYCNRRYDINGVSYFCTASAGVVMLGRDADSYMSLVKYADSALRASKQRGKNTCTFFTQELMRKQLWTQRLVNQLQISASKGMERFTLVYQPLHRARDYSVIGAEALLRWSCDSLGAVSPQEFVPLLERNGLITAVGSWVLEEAVKTCRRWLAYQPNFIMNINISYLQMMDPGFLPLVQTLLRRYELSPRHVVLEMTESYFVTNIDMLRDIFQQMRAMGIRIAMDDFGTGYSSLGLLSQLPADEVKIDRAFITQIDRHGFNRSFIGAVIQLCHSVGIMVCVEGVETQEELGTVVTLGADQVQGYWFSRPVSETQFRELYWSEAHAGCEC
jgi:diguanylate cyclase (GGDEF)-like protein